MGDAGSSLRTGRTGAVRRSVAARRAVGAGAAGRALPNGSPACDVPCGAAPNCRRRNALCGDLHRRTSAGGSVRCRPTVNACRRAAGRLFADAFLDGQGCRHLDACGAENVQAQPYGDVFERFLRAYRVAGGVERRCEGRQPHQPRDDGHDAAADSRFGRKPRVEKPVAGVLVEAHGGHHRRDVRREVGMEHLLPCHGIGAAVGDRGGHDGELPGRHSQRTLARVEVERQRGVVVDAVEVLEQPRDRTVVEVGLALGAVEFVDH